MMKIDSPLGTTAHRVIVDLDAWQVSYGPDSDSVHCWTCADADAMSGGAWLIPGPQADGRLAWGDEGVRYMLPAGMVENRTKTVVCCGCAIRLGFGDTAKAIETTAQREQRLAAKRAGIGTN